MEGKEEGKGKGREGKGGKEDGGRKRRELDGIRRETCVLHSLA